MSPLSFLLHPKFLQVRTKDSSPCWFRMWRQGSFKWLATPPRPHSNIVLAGAHTGINHGPCSVEFSRSVMSDSLRPRGLQHARLPCPSPTPRAWPYLVWLSRMTLSSRDNFAQCRQYPFISPQTVQELTWPLSKTVPKDFATDISSSGGFLGSPDGPLNINMRTVSHLLNFWWTLCDVTAIFFSSYLICSIRNFPILQQAYSIAVENPADWSGHHLTPWKRYTVMPHLFCILFPTSEAV